VATPDRSPGRGSGGRPCRRAGWLACAAGAMLAIGALPVPAAFASPGDLAFAGCIGLLPDCTGVSPFDAVVNPVAEAVTPDGRNLYVASDHSFTVSHFVIDRTGNLSYAGCIRNLPGCTLTISRAIQAAIDRTLRREAAANRYTRIRPGHARRSSGSACMGPVSIGSGTTHLTADLAR
jgi:hypothetical protein